MIRAAVIGATGYTGLELIEILLKHPEVSITNVSGRVEKPVLLSQLHPRLQGRTGIICKPIDIKTIITEAEIVFLALPHTVSMEFVPALLKAGKRVVDLSADYRLRKLDVYRKFYGIEHKDRLNLSKAVYGLPEIYRQKIKQANLVANPGCYPTCSLLALAPLVGAEAIDGATIIIDAKSGVSGAGKKLAQDYLFNETDEDFRPYKVNTHQHMPEIVQELSKLTSQEIKLSFVPHLLPLFRGMMASVYALKRQKTMLNIQQLFKRFYKEEPFVRVLPEGVFPRIKDVAGTNFCSLGLAQDKERIIVVSAIDNLLKGASGQAVQNMNIMYGLPETEGLL